jgi:hypothetical protein
MDQLLDTRSGSRIKKDRVQRSRAAPASEPGAGDRHSRTTSLTDLSPEWQRFALLLVQAMEDVAGEAAVPEADVRSMIYRMFQAAVLQGRRVPGARLELAKVLGPSLREFDPVPCATVEQAADWRRCAPRFFAMGPGPQRLSLRPGEPLPTMRVSGFRAIEGPTASSP